MMEYTEFSREKWLRVEIRNLEQQHYWMVVNDLSYRAYTAPDGTEVERQTPEDIEAKILKLRQELERVTEPSISARPGDKLTYTSAWLASKQLGSGKGVQARIDAEANNASQLLDAFHSASPWPASYYEEELNPGEGRGELWIKPGSEGATSSRFDLGQSERHRPSLIGEIIQDVIGHDGKGRYIVEVR